MIAEYLLVLPDGTTDGPYSEEDLLDMVDADEISAGAVCEDLETGRRLRIRELFKVIPPEPAAISPKPAEPARPAPAPVPSTRWVPAPLPPESVKKPPTNKTAGSPPVRTYFTGSPSLLNYTGWLIFAVLLGAGGWYAGRWDGALLAGGWIAGGLVLAATLLTRSAHEYRVTNRRVEARTGLLSKSSQEIRIGDIRSINVIKSGLSGFFSIGTVVFSSAGGTGEDVVFRQIWRAHGVKDLVRRLQDRNH